MAAIMHGFWVKKDVLLGEDAMNAVVVAVHRYWINVRHLARTWTRKPRKSRCLAIVR